MADPTQVASGRAAQGDVEGGGRQTAAAQGGHEAVRPVRPGRRVYQPGQGQGGTGKQSNVYLASNCQFDTRGTHMCWNLS